MISRIIAGLTGIVLVVAPIAPGATVSFTNIADTASGFSNILFRESPDINNNGLVAFAGKSASGPNGYYVGSGGATTYVATGGNGRVKISDNGEIAFSDPSSGVFKASPGVLTPIAVPSGPLNTFSDVDINAAGTVVFYSNIDAGGRGWFTGNGGALTTIADSNSGPLTTSQPTFPSINALGTVVFRAGSTTDGEGIYTGNGGPITTIATKTGPYSSFGDYPSINDAGIVAFEATLDTGPDAFFRSFGGNDTIIATTGATSAYGQLGISAINNSGVVAFSAELNHSNTYGFYLGPDPVADKVIQTGDPLFGSTVAGLSGKPAFNDRGDLAFFYHLANDVEGIAVAHTPEPASLALLLALCMTISRRQRGPNRKRIKGHS
jgi:hypothetical protein